MEEAEWRLRTEPRSRVTGPAEVWPRRRGGRGDLAGRVAGSMRRPRGLEVEPGGLRSGSDSGRPGGAGRLTAAAADGVAKAAPGADDGGGSGGRPAEASEMARGCEAGATRRRD